MGDGSWRPGLGAAAIGLALLALSAWLRRGDDRASPTAARPPAPPATTPADVPEPEPDAAAGGAAKAPTASTDPDPLEQLDESAAAWSTVDMAALREALPDNLYWTMSAPTTDPEVLRRRAEERARWNVEYGKVLSNTATAEEVDAYYAHRRRLSEDYVQFASHVLLRHGGSLPPRDVALLKLAVEMHVARLEELPRQLADAHARRDAHDATRRAWLEQQRAFEETR